MRMTSRNRELSISRVSILFILFTAVIGCGGSSSSAVAKYSGSYGVTEYLNGARHLEGTMSVSDTGTAEYDVALEPGNALTERLLYRGTVSSEGAVSLQLVSGASTNAKMTGTIALTGGFFQVKDGRFFDQGGGAVAPDAWRWEAVCATCNT